MNKWGRAFTLWGFVVLGVSAIGQQGGGGGFGSSTSQGEVFPGSDSSGTSELGTFEKKSLLLTSGDKVTVTISAKKGQLLFVKIESDIFDAALEILSPTGMSLAKNDDQYEGEQAPFIALPLVEDGDYKVVVNNYRSNAGGPFRLYTKTSPFVELKQGLNSLKMPGEALDNTGELNLVANFEKGKFYYFSGANPGTAVFRSLARLIGPTGAKNLDFEEYQISSSYKVYEAKQSGRFIARMQGISNVEKSEVRFHEIDVIELDQEVKLVKTLQPFQAVLMKAQVLPGMIQYSKLEPPSKFLSRILPPSVISLTNDASYRALPNSTKGIWLPTKISSHYEGYRYFGKEGEQKHFVISQSSEPSVFALNQNLSCQSLEQDEKIQGTLERGQGNCYTLRGKQGDVVRLDLISDDFEPQMDLVDKRVTLITAVNWVSHRPYSILVFEKDESCLIRVMSVGGGGRGKYELVTTSEKPIKCVVGSQVEVNVSPFGVSRFEVDLKKDEVYKLKIKNIDWSSVIYDDGMMLMTQYLVFEGVGFQFLKPQKTGKHTLIFRNTKHGEFSLVKMRS
jgi:hypothetical protein